MTLLAGTAAFRSKGPDARPTNLVPQPTPFIGRGREVEAVGRLLGNQRARLVTLVGPGGTGKTRLAIQVAMERLNDFADGVFFVDLAPVTDPDLLPQAMAQIFGVREVGGRSTREALESYLASREILLLLDNFEHVVDGADLLPGLLRVSPGLFCLVTSREALNLQEEHLFPVEGLSYPAEGQTGGAASFEAVELFVDAARRVRPDFSLSEEVDGVSRICRLVEGFPLAIELAASWTRSLDAETIADEIQRSLDFLSTRMRNVPDRHRSMQAAFDYSWRLLASEEKGSFKRLSVFAGGFEREAAEEIAGTPLSILGLLMDKSLVRRARDGRFFIHELLRQFGRRRLQSDPEEEARVRQGHAEYYADYYERRTEELMGGGQQKAIGEIRRELENFRTAWRWSLANDEVDNIRKSADSFYLYCDYQGRFQESVELFMEAIRRLDDNQLDRRKQETLGLLCVLAGYGAIRVGRFDRARDLFSRSQACYKSLGIQSTGGFSTDPADGLALLALTTGDYEEAIRFAEEALIGNEATGNMQELQIARYILSGAFHAQGHLEEALTHAQQALALSHRTQNRWMRAYILSRLGEVARSMGEYAQAQNHFEASYELKRGFDDPEGMAAALNQLAQTVLLQGVYEEAEGYFRHSQAIYREIGDRGGLVTSLLGLADTARAKGELELSASFLGEALTVALDMRWWPQLLLLLISAGELWRKADQPARGAELASLALHHPSSDHETRKRAERCLELAWSALSPEEHLAAVERGAGNDLAATVTAQIGDLSVFRVPVESKGPRERSLVEPLTDRELEVLQLMAAGLTNPEIADRLVIAVGTVKSYTSQIYGKLGVRGRVEAVNRAREIGLLS